MKGAGGRAQAPLGELLRGVRIAVTRAGERGGPLAAALRRVGATVHEIPLTRIETLDLAPLHAAVGRLADYDWILLTSVNAVEHLARVVNERGVDAAMATRRLAVVGTATAQACDAQGWRAPTVQPEKMQAEGMLDLMAERSDIEGARMLYPSAAGARDVLPEGLRALGATVDVVPCYRSGADPDGQATVRQLVAAGELDLVTVAAPSAVDSLLDALPPEHASRLPVAAIGPVTARAARVAGFPVKVESTAATMEGWVKAIVAAYRGGSN
ncbi:uroporphyrinogen-III synthase [Gemmatimonas sp.]|uniref:uroporphyrinogen-III synthase n=1 Tax=Gemmatimonas sp. TaxID=1962908 RepID=UPI0037C075D2